MFTDARSARQRGVTLVELIMFIVIVSVAVAGLLQVLRLTNASSADPMRRKQALMIAEGLMEEVQLAKFSYCDLSDDNAATASGTAGCSIAESFGQRAPEPVGPRPYDNVNDYVTMANNAEAAFDVGGVLSDASGTPLALNGYTVRLTIVPENLGGIVSGNSATDVGEVLRISVAVSYDGQVLVLDGYRTRYAPNAP